MTRTWATGKADRLRGNGFPTSPRIVLNTGRRVLQARRFTAGSASKRREAVQFDAALKAAGVGVVERTVDAFSTRRMCSSESRV